MEKFCIPVVSAIIERGEGEDKEILLQTRYKPDVSPTYTGLFEIQAGALREFENVYDGLVREIKEETNLVVKRFKEHPKSREYSYFNDKGFAFRPFCCEFMEKGAPFLGVVFLVEAEEGELIAQKTEVKDPHWIKVSELKQIFQNHPDKFFTLHAGALEFYLSEN